jgi:hypothetical protein
MAPDPTNVSKYAAIVSRFSQPGFVAAFAMSAIILRSWLVRFESGGMEGDSLMAHTSEFDRPN